MLCDMDIPDNILLNLIINRIKENSINLVQITDDGMVVKLNKMNKHDWVFDEVYHIRGNVADMLDLMRKDSHVVYVETSNVNDGLVGVDIRGKLVVHNRL